MEDQEINFRLLRSLLQRCKWIDQTEVSQILYGGNTDPGEDPFEEDAERVVGLLKEMGCRTYLQFKNVGNKNLQSYLEQKREDRFPRADLAALEKLYDILNTKMPEEPSGPEATLNSIDESEGITLASGPSDIKLGSDQSVENKGCAHFSLTKVPLAVLPHSSGTEMMDVLLKKFAITNVPRMLTEGAYNIWSVRHPICMEAKSADASAKTVMPENYRGEGTGTVKRPRLVLPNPQSTPEWAAGIKLEGWVPKSDEWKSFPSEGIEELIQTALGHILSSYFRSDAGGQSWCFYEKPPWALAFLSAGPAVMCVFTVEMVGILVCSIYVGACTVAGKEYNDHIEMLNRQVPLVPLVDLERVPLTPCSTVGKKVQWTTAPVEGHYYKVIRYNLFHPTKCPLYGIGRGENWRRLYHVYEKYRKECNVMDAPTALVKAYLLYGEFQVAVKMPFLSGATLADDSSMLKTDTDDLCDALVFLATKGFVYTDFRPQNVIRVHANGRIRLIDYDDMKIVSADTETLKREYERISAKIPGNRFGTCVKTAISAAITRLVGG